MEKKRHMIDIIFIFLLIGVFAISSVTLLVLGADVYKKTVRDDRQTTSIRTAALYFHQKLHSSDQEDAVRLTRLESGQQALVLSEGEMETWIFLSGDSLHEAVVKKGTTVTEHFGQPVVSLSRLTYQPLKPDLLRITAAAPDGTKIQTDLFLHCSHLEVTK